MTVPIPPSATDYQGTAAASGVITTSANAGVNGGGTDIWGLGDLYGRSVYLGTTPDHVEYNGLNGSDINGPPVPAGAANAYGQTQQFMQHVVDLWSAQTEERKHFPNRLTTYEQLQRSLWQAGFFGQTPLDSVHVGQWTSQTQDALVGALGQYEQISKGGKLPLTFSEFLGQNAQMGQDGGQNGGGSGAASTKAPFQADLADPMAIRAAAQNAAQQALGKNLSSAELEQFVSQFQAAQTSSQKTAYNGSGTITQPDLTNEAMAFAQQEDPKAYHQSQRESYLSALVNLFGGVRPSTAPVAPVGA